MKISSRSPRGRRKKQAVPLADWHVYIIECKDGKLYTGITNNLKRRIQAHNSGNGCRFTKYRYPVKLVYSEKVLDKPVALKREIQIKCMRRPQKLRIIGGKSKCS